MPEMPNVISGEVIESDWGNSIRDRTVQRYASAAARSASHATPVQGDLSFLSDTGKVYVYYSGSWRQFDADHASSHNMGGTDPLAADEVDGAASTSSFSTLTGFSDVCTVTLSIPASWAGWKCFATASFTYEGGGAANALQMVMRINGTDGPQNNVNTQGSVLHFGSLIGRRTGITATGSCPVDLRAKMDTTPAYTLRTVFLYARAIRTS